MQSKPIFFTVMLLGLTSQGQSAAYAQPAGKECAAPAVAVCEAPAPLPSGNDNALRALRLQNAVDNGDLSPQEAQKILKSHPHGHHGLGFNSSDPAAQPPGGGHRNRFWRDERRRLQPADPNAPPSFPANFP
ncbi:MAG: hypothetical protein JO171_19615 [Paludibacterium sp.]|uniref:hypothetical protein n=1 Tax=Paludibacterium sp. TaxID=1917523 RepID=UPI0025F006CD|nr:hypothetical protein [Paludibacterium sp.]MBV8049366.1 hypothetical protein [Paludibacterium sp.]MBV8646703.1 hypothetical protein [Paludibacterium sp.]